MKLRRSHFGCETPGPGETEMAAGSRVVVAVYANKIDTNSNK